MCALQATFILSIKKEKLKRMKPGLYQAFFKLWKKNAYLTAFVNEYLIPHGSFENRPPLRVIEITATRVLQPFHLWGECSYEKNQYHWQNMQGAKHLFICCRRSFYSLRKEHIKWKRKKWMFKRKRGVGLELSEDTALRSRIWEIVTESFVLMKKKTR